MNNPILTIAIADSLLHKKEYADSIRYWARRYPNRGYGSFFKRWIYEDLGPYNSYGNGSAMRVSPIGYWFDDINDVLSEAQESAVVTHNHPEGIKGATATAAAIFLARFEKSKDIIKKYLEEKFGYNISFTLDEIRPYYHFDETCQGTVPQAIAAFLESNDYESAIRNAISIGGDSDTIAAITGGIAHACYKNIPDNIITNAKLLLPKEMMNIILEFENRINKVPNSLDG